MLDAISGMEIEQQQLKQHTEKLPISRCRFLSVDTAINFNPTPRVVCKAVFDAKTPSNSLQQRSVYLPIRYIMDVCIIDAIIQTSMAISFIFVSAAVAAAHYLPCSEFLTFVSS